MTLLGPVNDHRKSTLFRRYLRTRAAILNGEKLFDLSREDLKLRGFMRPVPFNLYKTVVTSMPALAIGWLLARSQQLNWNDSGAMEPLGTDFGKAVLVQWQIVKAMEHAMAAFLVPAVPLMVAVLVSWCCLHRADLKPETRQQCRRAFLYFDAAYGLLPQMLFSTALVLFAHNDWISRQVGEDTWYAFNFLMGLPLVVAGLWPAYVLFSQIPRLLFDLNGYGEPEGIVSASARLPRPWTRFLSGSIITMVLVLSLVHLALPVYYVPLPAPSGLFAVGRVAYSWVDTAPREGFSSGLESRTPIRPREIMANVWYPAAPVKPGAVTAPYFPYEVTFRGTETTKWGKAWPMIVARQVHTHVYENAPIAEGGALFPLIIFSSGFHLEPFGYTHQIEELVSRGYIVVTLSHPYDVENSWYYPRTPRASDENYWPLLESGLTLEYLQWQDEHVEAWAGDILFTVGQLTRMNRAPQSHGPFAGRMDVNRVGVFGHAFGGIAAARACQLDPRIKGCLNQDGIVMVNGPIRRYDDALMPTQAFMFLRGLSEPEWESMVSTQVIDDRRRPTQTLVFLKGTAEPDRRAVKNFEQMIEDDLWRCSGNTYQVRVPGYIHSEFTDRPFLQAIGNTPDIAEALQSQTTAESYTIAFFDKFLNGRQDTLLDRKPPVGSGVQVTRYH